MAFVKIVNAEGGSDARYDVNQATPEERMQLDSEGRPLSANLPDQWTWTDGLPGARGGNSPGGGSVTNNTGGATDMTANPYFQQYQASLRADQAADLTDTQGQIRQLLIQFGLVPEGYKDSLGALDDTIRQLIEQNTSSGISQYARDLEGKGDAQRSTIGSLGSRGLLRSGAKGYRLRRNQLDFDRTFSDHLQGLLGTTGQLQSGYAGRERQRQTNLAQMLSQIFANYYRGNYSSGGGGGRGVPPVPSVPQAAPVYEPSNNPWNDYTGNTIGSGSGGYGTPFAPAAPGQGGGFTSPKKPLLYA